MIATDAAFVNHILIHWFRARKLWELLFPIVELQLAFPDFLEEPLRLEGEGYK